MYFTDSCKYWSGNEGSLYGRFWAFLKGSFCYNRETWLIGTSIIWPSHGNYLERPQQLHITTHGTILQCSWFSLDMYAGLNEFWSFSTKICHFSDTITYWLLVPEHSLLFTEFVVWFPVSLSLGRAGVGGFTRWLWKAYNPGRTVTLLLHC